MKTIHFILLAVIAVAGIFVTVLFCNDNEKPLPQISVESNQKKMHETTAGSVSEPDELGFKFVIESIAQRPTNELLGRSVLTGQLMLAKQTDSALWYGQVSAAAMNENGKQTQFKKPLYFTAKYLENVFTEIDLLGLAQTHPLNSIGFMLEQLSYDLEMPILIKQASGTTLYRYSQSANVITRMAIEQDHPASQLNVTKTQSDENWQLVLEHQMPLQMDYQNAQHYETETGQLVVRQNVTLTRSSVTVDWQQTDFIAGSNSDLKFDRAAQTVAKITSEQQFAAALERLSQSTDKILAKAIGQYLLAHYDSNGIVELINAQDPKSNIASLLIYAIQKATGFEAEVMLAELFEHPALDTDNKRRVLMSMGRFEGASEQTLTALKQFSQNDEKSLADTALLSIGSLARFSKEQKQQVEDYLDEQLADPGRRAMAIIAIKNSGSTRFHDKIEQLLGHQDQSVNIAAIKLLARSEKYQDKLLSQTTQSGDVQAISTLRTVLAGQGRSLTAGQIEKINEAIEKARHPVVKKQLLALLNLEQENWDK